MFLAVNFTIDSLYLDFQIKTIELTTGNTYNKKVSLITFG